MFDDVDLSKIQTIHTDENGEAFSLGYYLSSVGIQYLKSPPHTLEYVGTVECKYRHLVEIGLTLLHHASMPLEYWSLTFQVVVHLINHMSSKVTTNKSLFFHLFK